VARECDGTDRVMKTVCPRRCRRRYADAQGPGHVDWAGLPVNLDLAFSPEKRDKVYVQHLMRKQGSQLERLLQGAAQVCACEVAAGDERIDTGAARSVPGR
jgi:hypothetical protein